MILIKSGAPVPVIFNVTPQFLREITAPEPLISLGPMALQIYNYLARRGEAYIEDIAKELRVDDKTRDEFNNAVAQLISMGYARLVLDENNRMKLRVVR